MANLFSEEEALDRLRMVASRDVYDFYLIAGDVLRGTGIDYAEELLRILPLERTFAILGNNDPPVLGSIFDQHGIYVHGKKKRMGEWGIFGLSGGLPTPQRESFELTDEEMGRILDSAEIDEFTILLTHYPPYGLFDNVGGVHTGVKSLRPVIDEKKPLMDICGHINGEGGRQIVGETMVVKAASISGMLATEITIDDKITVKDVKLG